MGPPREHGGMAAKHRKDFKLDVASMGPPREHGGMPKTLARAFAVPRLQWGRRVNTAEWSIDWRVK